jgi:hypothetical protein
MRDSKIFDEAATRFFGPIARSSGLRLFKVQEGGYDIASPDFIMRVRLHTGHRRGLNVILRPASEGDFDENKPGLQYGIGCFIQFYGEALEKTFIPVDSDEDFLEQARLLAEAAQRYCIPHLLGQGKDLELIQQMIRKKTEEDLKKIGKLTFPSFVHEEWIPRADD